MSFLDNHGLSSLWNKIQDKLATKADSSHDHTSISGTAEDVTGVVDIAHGGTGSPTRNGALRALINGGSGFTGDLNTLTNTGVYWVDLSDCTNGPASSGSGYGTMEVISYEVILQRFTSYQDGNVYCRTYTNSQWYEWQEILGTNSVVPISSGGTGSTNRGEAYKTLITGGVVSSDEQHDLNDYKTPGVYWINLSNHSNGPGTTGHGHLEVISGSKSLFIQRFTYYTGNIYYRTFANGQWYDWKQIPTAVVGIENGGTGANNATDARKNLGAAADVVERYAPCYGADKQPYTDLWMIDINSPFGGANSDWSFGTEDASTLINSPVTSGPFYGYRKVYQVHSSAAHHYKTIVEIHEAYPMRGRIWTSEYNPDSGWSGWWHNYTNADQIPISNGGTGASNTYDAQMNLNMVHSHDISAPGGQDDWRNKALAQIKENAKAGGFQCGNIGWQGVQYGQYFATTSGGTTDRILALIYNSAGTNWALEVWRYEDNVWNACAVKGASLQTMPELGYGTADQRPAAGLPGRIYFQKV